jgi:hypothetical protein
MAAHARRGRIEPEKTAVRILWDPSWSIRMRPHRRGDFDGTPAEAFLSRDDAEFVALAVRFHREPSMIDSGVAGRTVGHWYSPTPEMQVRGSRRLPVMRAPRPSAFDEWRHEAEARLFRTGWTGSDSGPTSVCCRRPRGELCGGPRVRHREILLQRRPATPAAFERAGPAYPTPQSSCVPDTDEEVAETAPVGGVRGGGPR